MYPTAAGLSPADPCRGDRPRVLGGPPCSTPTGAPGGHPAAPDAGPRGRGGGWGMGGSAPPPPPPPGSADSARSYAALHHPRRNNSGCSVAAPRVWSSAPARGPARAREGPAWATGMVVEGLGVALRPGNGTRNGRVEWSCGRRARKRCLFPPPRTRAGSPGTAQHLAAPPFNCRSPQLGLNT